MKHRIKTALILWVTLFSFVPACFCCVVEALEAEHHHHANEQITSELCFKDELNCLEPTNSCENQDKEHSCCIHPDVLTTINFQLEKQKIAPPPIFGTLDDNKLHLLAPKYSKVYSVNSIPHYQKERTLAELCRFLI